MGVRYTPTSLVLSLPGWVLLLSKEEKKENKEEWGKGEMRTPRSDLTDSESLNIEPLSHILVCKEKKKNPERKKNSPLLIRSVYLPYPT